MLQQQFNPHIQKKNNVILLKTKQNIIIYILIDFNELFERFLKSKNGICKQMKLEILW